MSYKLQRKELRTKTNQQNLPKFQINAYCVRLVLVRSDSKSTCVRFLRQFKVCIKVYSYKSVWIIKVSRQVSTKAILDYLGLPFLLNSHEIW